ncbi:hypothetical protein P167DRAFT_24221 [Morchella conica CCBAS932]|uniref:Uncharacterized protein n=1 Tax=Morchella conica CCBAS932 TaxID=1392247 RepID=A0A3N4K8T6_9PEZI|nr:hypothetical protein P167DRAFT_24221 [Morchella conica CCBAS932]
MSFNENNSQTVKSSLSSYEPSIADTAQSATTRGLPLNNSRVPAVLGGRKEKVTRLINSKKDRLRWAWATANPIYTNTKYYEHYMYLKSTTTVQCGLTIQWHDPTVDLPWSTDCCSARKSSGPVQDWSVVGVALPSLGVPNHSEYNKAWHSQLLPTPPTWQALVTYGQR